MRKKLLGVLLVGGAVVGIYAAREQIRAFWLDVRDRIAARILELSIDDPGEDERATVYPGDEYMTAPRKEE